MPSHPFRPMALATLAIAATQALAQSSPSPAPPSPPQRVEVTGQAATRLDEPSAGTSRLNLSVRQQPASVTVVDQAAIEAMGAMNTQDILAAVAEVGYARGLAGRPRPADLWAHIRSCVYEPNYPTSA